MAALDHWLSHPIFSAAGLETCQTLEAQFPICEHDPDTLIASCGDPADHLVAVLSGTVRLYHQAAGKEVTVKLLRAPNTFGEPELLQGLHFLVSLATVDRAGISKIPAAVYLRLLQDHPPALMALARHMAAAFCVAAFNERRALVPLEPTLAAILLSYGDYFGQPEAGGLLIEQPLTKPTLARLAGATERSVGLVLSSWRRQGLVERRRDSVLLGDPAALESIAGPVRHCLCYQIGMPLQHLLAEAPAPRAELELLSGPSARQGRREPIGLELRIGRRPPCQLLLADELVSPQHCRVFLGKTGGRYWVEDLGSLNGTLVNGRDKKRTALRHGDVIQVGGCRLRFHLSREPDTGAARP